MLMMAAVGLGLLVAGLFFSLTAGGTSDRPPSRQIAVAVARVLLYVVLAIEATVILARIDSTIATIVVVVLVGLGVAWSVVRALASPTPARALGVLGLTLGLSVAMAVVLSVVLGGGAAEPALAVPTATVADPVGDCDCDTAYDLLAVGSDPDGTVWVTVGDVVPQGATFLVWTALDPYTPMQFTRSDDSWNVLIPEGSRVRADDVVAVEMADGMHLRLGTDIGAFAVVSGQGDRAPDSGYAGGTGRETSSELDEQYQRAYGDLDDAQRGLAVLLMGSMLANGEFTYDVGVSADPGVARSGTLSVQDGSVVFQMPGTGSQGAHTDRFSSSDDDVCLDDGQGPCVAMWVNPFAAFDDLLAGPSAVEVVALEPREVLGEIAACIGVTSVGSTTLHEGEFCGFEDGSLALADDRTVGIVAVLTDRAIGGDA